MGAVQESHGRKKNTQVLAAMVFLFLSKWIETTFENLNASMSYIYRATIESLNYHSSLQERALLYYCRVYVCNKLINSFSWCIEEPTQAAWWSLGAIF